MKLTTVILTRNEESNIIECLNSVSFSEELLVIDDNSSDSTREIAEKMGAKVIKRSLDGNYAMQKNIAVSRSKHEMILFIDADERVSKELREEILENLKNEEHLVYKFRRRDRFLDKWLKHGETGSFRDIRLMKRGSGVWKRRVHEHFITDQKVGEFKNPILHYSHRNISSMVESINRWSGLHALANKEEGKQSNIVKIFIWPLLKYIDNFVLKLGFLDGIHGFVFSIFMSFHSFLAWSNLWLLQKRK